jgi:flagellar motor switch protein FliM
MDSYVSVTAEMGSADITFGDLMKFEVGNVINLGKSVSDDLVIKVDNVQKFMGRPGYSRGNQAIKVTKIN